MHDTTSNIHRAPAAPLRGPSRVDFLLQEFQKENVHESTHNYAPFKIKKKQTMCIEVSSADIKSQGFRKQCFFTPKVFTSQSCEKNKWPNSFVPTTKWTKQTPTVKRDMRCETLGLTNESSQSPEASVVGFPKVSYPQELALGYQVRNKTTLQVKSSGYASGEIFHMALESPSQKQNYSTR